MTLADSDEDDGPAALGDRDSDWMKTSFHINGNRYWNLKRNPPQDLDEEDDFELISEEEVNEIKGTEPEPKPYFPDQLLDMINGELSEEQIKELAEAMRDIDCFEETEEPPEADDMNQELTDAQKALMREAILDIQ